MSRLSLIHIYNMGYVDVSDFCKDVMRNYDIKEDKAVPVLLAPDLPDYRIYTGA